MKSAIGIAMVLALGACSTKGSQQPTTDKPIANGGSGQGSGPGSATMTDMTKKPDPGGAVFVAGPAVTPAAALLTWLDAQQRDGEPRLLRLPIVLTRDDGGFSNRAVTIGAAADAVAIFANDAALGIGLEQRARSLCKTEPTCAVRIEGYWRGKQEGDYTVDVMKVLDVLSADTLAAAHAEVEGDSGN